MLGKGFLHQIPECQNLKKPEPQNNFITWTICGNPRHQNNVIFG
jgi:hypothetical protein